MDREIDKKERQKERKKERQKERKTERKKERTKERQKERKKQPEHMRCHGTQGYGRSDQRFAVLSFELCLGPLQLVEGLACR